MTLGGGITFIPSLQFEKQGPRYGGQVQGRPCLQVPVTRDKARSPGKGNGCLKCPVSQLSSPRLEVSGKT